MAKKAAWTVLVYLAGDNNLTTECVFALTEMKQAAVGNTDTGSPVTLYSFISFCRERGVQRRATRISQTAAWRSPYYWSGFIIQGQYDQKESFGPTRSGKTIPAVIAVAGASFLLASVLFLRRRRRVTVNA